MCAAAMDVPLPVNGSHTTSPMSLNAFTKNSTSARGKGAECDPWLPSALASITLLGQAMPAILLAPQPSRPGATWRGRVIGRVHHYVVGFMAGGLRAELDLLIPAEVKY